MNITIGFGQRHNVEALRAKVLGWPAGTGIEEDSLHNTRHLVAVTSDGSIIGAVSCTLSAFPNGEGANFGNLRAVRFWALAVEPQYQSNGVGSRLMDAVIGYARDLDARILWAHSRESALPFYEQIGFDTFGAASPGSVTGLPGKRVALNMTFADV